MLHRFESNFDENSPRQIEFTFQRVEADVLNKEYKERNAGIAKDSTEHITFVSAEGRKTDLESQFHNARREPGHAHNGEVIGEYSNRDGSARRRYSRLQAAA